MQGTTSTIIMDVPSKVIYGVVADFESYPEFLPDVKKVIDVEKKGKKIVAGFEISVIKKIYYKLSFSLTPFKKISWSFVEGDIFKDNRGHWDFEAEGKGKTKVSYHIEVDFGFMVPSLITNRLVGTNLPTMLKRFKKRAENLCG